VRITKKHLTSVLPAQRDDLVVEYIEIKALPRVPFVSSSEEVIASFEEVPSVVSLDSPQLGKFVLFLFAFGAESI
jgi:hypothetical protein